MFQRVGVAVMSVGAVCFALCWQFNQFIFLLQALALFGVWVLDLVPAHKVL